MDFFGIGIGEVILILIVALLVLGPERIPEVGRTLGKAARFLKKGTIDLTAEVAKEIEDEESEKERPPGQGSGKTEGL